MRVQYDPQLDSLVTSKLISSLVTDCGPRCTVMEQNGDDNHDTADAVLTGAMVIQQYGDARPRVQGAIILVTKDGDILWADTVYSSAFTRSASSSFADNTAKKLVGFLNKAE